VFWMLRFRMSRALSRKRACVPVVRVTVKRTAPRCIPRVPVSGARCMPHAAVRYNVYVGNGFDNLRVVRAGSQRYESSESARGAGASIQIMVFWLQDLMVPRP
jgi:hypothetical protein